jgi:hypothetical protein
MLSRVVGKDTSKPPYSALEWH